jgi:hypothetical protein
MLFGIQSMQLTARDATHRNVHVSGPPAVLPVRRNISFPESQSDRVLLPLKLVNDTARRTRIRNHFNYSAVPYYSCPRLNLLPTKVCDLLAKLPRPGVVTDSVKTNAMPRSLPSRDVVLIHIGKSGGSTVIPEIKSAVQRLRHLNVSYVHVVDAMTHEYSTQRLFVIVMRNPIRRFVSAFYYRSPESDPRNIAYRDTFDARFKSVSMFAEALYSDGALNVTVLKAFKSNPHIKMNIAHYLTRFLASIPSHSTASASRNIFVITQEALAQDAKVALDLDIDVHKNRGRRPRCMTLTSAALSNLRRFLAPDFAVVERLHELGALTPMQHAALSDPVCTQDSEWCVEGNCSSVLLPQPSSSSHADQ